MQCLISDNENQTNLLVPISLFFTFLQFASSEASSASAKKPKTSAAMTFFAPLTRLQPGRHTQVAPPEIVTSPGAEPTSPYILEIDAQSR